MTKPFVTCEPGWFDVAKKLIDLTKPVEVYKNLHKGCWSVRQGGIVRFHAEYVTLHGPQFIVGQKGRERVRREGKKNVHAFVRGYLCEPSETNVAPEGWDTATYNPYRFTSFVIHVGENDHKPIDKGEWCDMMVNDDISPVLVWGAK